jgi:peptidyl-dipeptidase Dcp
VRVEHFEPALESAMKRQLEQIDAIVADPAPPTFANTLEAMERSGRTLARVLALYGVFASTMRSPDFQAVERLMAPRLAAFRDRIVQNAALFGRIEAVYEARDAGGLDAEQKRLAWLKCTDFARSGARLDEQPKQRLSAINQRLAALYTTFSQNVLADESERFTLVERGSDLDGLALPQREAAAAAARERGHPGKWAILNTRSSVEPFLAAATNRDLRKKVWTEFVTRGDHGGAHDNKAVIAEIVRLRAERARLLGFATHAHWRLERSMAGTPERAMALMEAVWPGARTRVAEDVAAMQALADAAGDGIHIEPWDYRYYTERVRKEKHDFDQSEVKPYLQLERLREAMFWVAGELLGLAFTPRDDIPVVHPDVRVWEVAHDDGHFVGLFYFDPYARAAKRSGAWMNAYRSQERFDGEIATLVSNNANFIPPAPGEPALLGWDDARTLFHEFGHALHGLSSGVRYPSLAGTAVDRDFVEFPSQLLEHWLLAPAVLEGYARHYETGEPMPARLLEKVQRAARFNQGFDTVEYLASALVDLRMHLADPDSVDPEVFERETLAALGMPREIVMRHRLPHFGHLFDSDAYSAGYYSYLWADTLTADAYEAFTEAGGPFDVDVARRLHDHVLSVGNTVDPAEAYRAFRGRDAGIEALLRKRGFA